MREKCRENVFDLLCMRRWSGEGRRVIASDEQDSLLWRKVRKVCRWRGSECDAGVGVKERWLLQCIVSQTLQLVRCNTNMEVGMRLLSCLETAWRYVIRSIAGGRASMRSRALRRFRFAKGANAVARGNGHSRRAVQSMECNEESRDACSSNACYSVQERVSIVISASANNGYTKIPKGVGGVYVLCSIMR